MILKKFFFFYKFSSTTELRGHLKQSLELRDNTEMLVYAFKLPFFFWKISSIKLKLQTL